MENEYFIFYVGFEDKIMPIYCREIKVDPILEGHTLFIGIKHELANARNEYLNNGSNTCRSGEIDLSVEQRDTDYNYSDSNTHENQNLRLTFRKYLGVSQKECEERNKIQTQNELLKQQIELYKVCKQINTNQNLEQFKELLNYCRGIQTIKKERPNKFKNYLDKIK